MGKDRGRASGILIIFNFLIWETKMINILFVHLSVLYYVFKNVHNDTLTQENNF